MDSVPEWRPRVDDRLLTDDALKVEPDYLLDLLACLKLETSEHASYCGTGIQL